MLNILKYKVNFSTGKIYKSALAVYLLLVVLLLISAFFYWLKYDYAPFAPEGYDPLRYEYFARFGLPSYLDNNSGYKIVRLLNYLYYVGPAYWSFIFFLTVCCLNFVFHPPFYYSHLNPIFIFYASQTGKDGLTMLACLSFYLYLINKPSRSISNAIVLSLTILLAVSVRENSIIFLFLVLVLVRRSLLLSALLLGISIARFTTIPYNFFESVAAQGGEGLNDVLRLLTFGNDYQSVFFRLLFYIFSPIVQLAASFYRFWVTFELYDFTEFVAYFVSLIFLFKADSKHIYFNLIYVSLVLCLVQPFYHGRYFMIILPIIILTALNRKVRPLTWRK